MFLATQKNHLRERGGGGGGGGLNAFYWYQIFALDSAGVGSTRNVQQF